MDSIHCCGDGVANRWQGAGTVQSILHLFNFHVEGCGSRSMSSAHLSRSSANLSVMINWTWRSFDWRSGPRLIVTDAETAD
jgi:hypothetical protein